MNNIISSKVCTSCKESKLLNEFYKRSANLEYGLKSVCKICDKLRDINYYRTKNGLANSIYKRQKYHSKQRNHTPPNYTKQQFKNWLFSQPNFEQLYNDWVASGYNKMLVPSCDRDDDYLPYDLSRVTLMTWGENKRKGELDRKNGINNKQNRAVLGTHIITNEVVEFHSMAEAGRNGFKGSNISACCRGQEKTHYKYIWEYKTEPTTTQEKN